MCTLVAFIHAWPGSPLVVATDVRSACDASSSLCWPEMYRPYSRTLQPRCATTSVDGEREGGHAAWTRARGYLHEGGFSWNFRSISLHDFAISGHEARETLAKPSRYSRAIPRHIWRFCGDPESQW